MNDIIESLEEIEECIVGVAAMVNDLRRRLDSLAPQARNLALVTRNDTPSIFEDSLLTKGIRGPEDLE